MPTIERIFDPETDETLIDLSKLSRLTLEQLYALDYAIKSTIIKKINEERKNEREKRT